MTKDPEAPHHGQARGGSPQGAARRAAEGRLKSRPSADGPATAMDAGLHPLNLNLDLGPGAEALLAVPPGHVGSRPLVVFFHGAGGTAQHGLALIGGAARDRAVLVLAPSSVGRTWDLIAGGMGRDVALLDAALGQVSAQVAVSRTAVAGFSDGASYALSLGLANGDLFDAVLAFSPGFVSPPGLVGRPRIWISHGTQDRVLPVERCGRRVAGDLSAGGYDITYEEFRGGHVVPPNLVDSALTWWLAGQTPPRGSPRPGEG
jgi:phospholipase/carboxylesterase